MEVCVENQTMTDKNCLISCDGLYADITDDSLKQNVMRGENYNFGAKLYQLLGFETMSEELEKRLYWGGNQRIQAVLQEMFPDSLTDEKNGIVDKLTVAYHNYKQRYVKHLSFAPEEEILSERKLNSVMVY